MTEGNGTKLSQAVESVGAKMIARWVTPALMAALVGVIVWIGRGALNEIDEIKKFIQSEAQKTAVFRSTVEMVMRNQERYLEDHEKRVRDLERRP